MEMFRAGPRETDTPDRLLSVLSSTLDVGSGRCSEGGRLRASQMVLSPGAVLSTIDETADTLGNYVGNMSNDKIYLPIVFIIFFYLICIFLGQVLCTNFSFISFLFLHEQLNGSYA